jgi:hypothetical protein
LLLSLSYVQLFALTLLLVDTRERLKMLLCAVVGAGVFQSLYGGLMALSGVDLVWWMEKTHHRGMATGTFLNRNQLANYLVIALAFGCGLLVSLQKGGERGNTWRAHMRRVVNWLLSGAGWLRILLAVLVIGIVLTHSRMGNMSLFVSLTLVGSIWLLRSRQSWRRAGFLLGSLLLVDALIIGAWFGIDKVVDRIQATESQHAVEWLGGVTQEKSVVPVQEPVPANTVAVAPSPAPAGSTSAVPVAAPDVAANAAGAQKKVKTDPVNEIRDEALPQLIQMARDHAWKGIGLGNFSLLFPSYSELLIPYVYNEAHCDYLQFIIEVGVPGTAILALIVLCCAGFGLMALWSAPSRLLQGTGFAVSMACVASLLHAWVEFNFQSPATATLFIVVLALGLVAHSLPGGSGRTSPTSPERWSE